MRTNGAPLATLLNSAAFAVIKEMSSSPENSEGTAIAPSINILVCRSMPIFEIPSPAPQKKPPPVMKGPSPRRMSRRRRIPDAGEKRQSDNEGTTIY